MTQILPVAGLLLLLLILTEKLLFTPLHWIAAAHLPTSWGWIVVFFLVAWLMGER